MATKTPLKLPVRYNAARSKKLSAENLVNMFVEASPSGMAQFALYSAPVPRIFSVIGGGAPRGQINASGTHLVVIGNSLYTVATSGAATLRGTVDGAGLVDMAFDGLTVTIVTDARAYAYNPATAALIELFDPDLVNPTSVTTVDNYTVFTRRDSGIIQWSALGDGTAYDGLDFASAETSPDNLVAVRSSNQDLVLFGEDSIEFFRNTGDPTQIFQRSTSAAPIEIGCVSRDCIGIMDNTFYWLGRDRNSAGLLVYRAEGYSAKRISTHAIEALLESVPDVSTAQAFCYAQAGHTYFVLTLPDTATVVYDAATGEWHQRAAGSFAGNLPAIVTDADLHTFAMNGRRPIQTPIVARQDGNLYELSFGSFAATGLIDDVAPGASYTFVADDLKRRKIRSHTGAMTSTLPAAGSAGFESGKAFVTRAVGGANTITPASGTINLAANLVVAAGTEVRLVASGTDWLAFPYTHTGVVREVTFAPIYNANEFVPFEGFEIVVETGVLTGPDDPEPTIELFWSDDGGQTWTGGLSRSLGQTGQRRRIVRWRRNLGRGRNRSFRVRTASPVDLTILDAQVYLGGSGGV